MFSHHSPLYFQLKTNLQRDDVSYGRRDPMSINYRWNSKKLHSFRNGIIGQLTVFNELVMNCTVNTAQDMNTLVLNVTNTISDVANPLFVTQSRTESTCNTNEKRNAEWFDNECIAAQQLYKRALNQFNNCKSYENRQVLCNMKHEYKRIVHKKKYKHKMIQAT